MGKKRKGLKKRQLDVIEDLILGDMDEPQLLEKHKLTRRLFRLWMSQEDFAEELWLRMTSAHRQSVFLLARYAPMAAAKLIGLTDSDKSETVRKTCLDIIGAAERRPESARGGSAVATLSAENPPVLPISREKASEMLKMLAKENDHE
jgi:hypothetical protein